MFVTRLNHRRLEETVVVCIKLLSVVLGFLSPVEGFLHILARVEHVVVLDVQVGKGRLVLHKGNAALIKRLVVKVFHKLFRILNHRQRLAQVTVVSPHHIVSRSCLPILIVTSAVAIGGLALDARGQMLLVHLFKSETAGGCFHGEGRMRCLF
jgi:hypothetical protein